ncbi:MAG: flavodoxin family protein [Spirochaetales bacterium]|nr:flavodoxin family protein [Spirochaetales bacterium]
MKGLIIYSTLTGNTEKVARKVHSSFHNDEVELKAISDKVNPGDYDWIISAYWVDRGTADKKTLAFWDSLSGCRVGTVGTLGAYPDSDHAKNVMERVENYLCKENIYLGSFLCQGKVDPRLTEKFKDLPADHPHAMNEERRKRHEEAAKHPDERDWENAISAVRTMVSAL